MITDNSAGIETIRYTGANKLEVQEWLGKRPGDYKVDPYYLKDGIGNKLYFWDAYDKKWLQVSLGDLFLKSDGSAYPILAKD